MVDSEGIEPSTLCLQGKCYTVKLTFRSNCFPLHPNFGRHVVVYMRGLNFGKKFVGCQEISKNIGQNAICKLFVATTVHVATCFEMLLLIVNRKLLGAGDARRCCGR